MKLTYVIVLILEVNAHKMTLLSFNPCLNPEPAMAENVTDKCLETMIAFKEGQRFLIKGNITFFQDIRLFLRFKTGLETKSGLKFITKFERITCKNIVSRLIFISMNIKFDPNTCKILKGKLISQ